MSVTTQALPARFGAFYLYDLIGRGGMAEIFLAKTFTELGTDRNAAIKRILPHLARRDGFGEMLISEAKLCSRLSHRNIVQTYDLGKLGEHYFICMEYVEGFDLNKLLGLVSRASIALPLQFALYIVAQVARGLDYAHRLSDDLGVPLGIIHRDVSPTNVLISTEGEVKLCDFGIAKVTLGGFKAEPLDEFHLKGKVAYMSPEVIEGGEIDHRSDLYAAGILLYELLSGKRLYKRSDEEETLALARAAQAPPLEDRGFPVCELLESITRRALARDPAKRFQNGLEFVRALEDYMHAAGMLVSELKFADFLMEHFGERLRLQRRDRERNLAELLAREHDLNSGRHRPFRPSRPRGLENGEMVAQSIVATLTEDPTDHGTLSSIPPPAALPSEDDNNPNPAETVPIPLVARQKPVAAAAAKSSSGADWVARALLILIAAAAAGVAYCYFVK